MKKIYLLLALCLMSVMNIHADDPVFISEVELEGFDVSDLQVGETWTLDWEKSIWSATHPVDPYIPYGVTAGALLNSSHEEVSLNKELASGIYCFALKVEIKSGYTNQFRFPTGGGSITATVNGEEWEVNNAYGNSYIMLLSPAFELTGDEREAITSVALKDFDRSAIKVGKTWTEELSQSIWGNTHVVDASAPYEIFYGELLDASNDEEVPSGTPLTAGTYYFAIGVQIKDEYSDQYRFPMIDEGSITATVNGEEWLADNLYDDSYFWLQSPDFELSGDEPSGDRFVVVAQRKAGENWYYMTANVGTSGTKRYQAVDAGTSNLAAVVSSGLADEYYWEIEDGKYLKSGEYYSVWSSGNSANLGDYSMELTIDNSNEYYTFSFADGGDTRYLSLNKTSGNDYFAYYKGTQVNELYLIPEGGGQGGGEDDREVVTSIALQGFNAGVLKDGMELSHLYVFDNISPIAADAPYNVGFTASSLYKYNEQTQEYEDLPLPITVTPGKYYLSLYLVINDKIDQFRFPDTYEGEAAPTAVVDGKAWEVKYSFVQETYSGCYINSPVIHVFAQGIEDVQGDKVQSTKVIKDGQLFIIRDGKTFNAQGAEVK